MNIATPLAWIDSNTGHAVCGKCGQMAPKNQMLPVEFGFGIIKFCHSYRCPTLQEQKT